MKVIILFLCGIMNVLGQIWLGDWDIYQIINGSCFPIAPLQIEETNDQITVDGEISDATLCQNLEIAGTRFSASASVTQQNQSEFEITINVGNLSLLTSFTMQNSHIPRISCMKNSLWNLEIQQNTEMYWTGLWHIFNQSEDKCTPLSPIHMNTEDGVVFISGSLAKSKACHAQGIDGASFSAAGQSKQVTNLEFNLKGISNSLNNSEGISFNLELQMTGNTTAFIGFNDAWISIVWRPLNVTWSGTWNIVNVIDPLQNCTPSNPVLISQEDNGEITVSGTIMQSFACLKQNMFGTHFKSSNFTNGAEFHVPLYNITSNWELLFNDTIILQWNGLSLILVATSIENNYAYNSFPFLTLVAP